MKSLFRVVRVRRYRDGHKIDCISPSCFGMTEEDECYISIARDTVRFSSAIGDRSLTDVSKMLMIYEAVRVYENSLTE